MADLQKITPFPRFDDDLEDAVLRGRRMSNPTRDGEVDAIRRSPVAGRRIAAGRRGRSCPGGLPELSSSPDPAVAARVMKATMRMTKIDIAVLGTAAAATARG